MLQVAIKGTVHIVYRGKGRVYFKTEQFKLTVVFSDSEITELINEQKLLPEGWKAKIQLKPKTGHKERELDLEGENGSEFRLIFRQSQNNYHDFSVILAVKIPGSTQLFRLRRYNGKHHKHTNPIEGNSFYDYHIHYATERYQKLGAKEDTYAEATDRFTSYNDALNCMLEDNGFEKPSNKQLSMLDGLPT